MKSFYVYLNKYRASASGALYYYVGMHSWNGEGVDPNYFGSSRVAAKFGWKPFAIEVIEFCSSIEELSKRETYWIDFYCTKYGLADCALNIASKDNIKFANRYRSHGLMLNLCVSTFEVALQKCHTKEVMDKSRATKRSRYGSLVSKETREAASSKESRMKALITTRERGFMSHENYLKRHEKASVTREQSGAHARFQQAGVNGRTSESFRKMSESKKGYYQPARMVSVYLDDKLVCRGTVSSSCEKLGCKTWNIAVSRGFKKGLTEVIHHGYKFVLDGSLQL